MKIIAIEANIGAGKSTLLPKLVEQLNKATGQEWSQIIEPVDNDEEFSTLLNDFITHPEDANKRIRFQLFITNQRQNLLKDLPDGNYIIERSLFSDIVFSQVSFLATERPDAAYMDYFYQIKSALKTYPKIDAIVYIDRSPSACKVSCEQRNRGAESEYTIDYFWDLKRFHDACLPQIAREYDTKLIINECGRSYPDAWIITQQLLHQKVI